MAKHFIHNRDESPPMFENRFLDLFSRVHWTMPLFVFVPVFLYFTYHSLFEVGVELWKFIPLFLLGAFVWSFAEYTLHRFVFHWMPPGKLGRRIHFIAHGVHHDYPSDRYRLVMPIPFSIPIAIGFYWMFSHILGPELVTAFFPGFVIGYLTYDIGHYALHHFTFKHPLLLKLKKHHMLHHYKDPKNGFGVSNKFWDVVFGTKLEGKASEAQATD